MTESISRNALAIALATGIGLASLGAVAADSGHKTVSAHHQIATGDTVRSDTILPGQMRASKVIGSAVYDRYNQKLGSVQDIVFDRDGKVAAVVVDVGATLGVGGKDVAVGMKDIKTDNDRFTLDRSKDQLQQAASYQLENDKTGAGTTATPSSDHSGNSH